VLKKRIRKIVTRLSLSFPASVQATVLKMKRSISGGGIDTGVNVDIEAAREATVGTLEHSEGRVQTRQGVFPGQS
jgi:hypothetical protein